MAPPASLAVAVLEVQGVEFKAASPRGGLVTPDGEVAHPAHREADRLADFLQGKSDVLRARMRFDHGDCIAPEFTHRRKASQRRNVTRSRLTPFTFPRNFAAHDAPQHTRAVPPAAACCAAPRHLLQDVQGADHGQGVAA